MGLRMDSEGSVAFNVVTESAKISRDAYIRDAEETDVNTFLVQESGSPYIRETVTPSGNYTVSDVNGGKKYTFGSGYERSILSYGGNNKTVDAKYRIVYTVSTNGSTVLSSGGTAYYNLSTAGGSGKVLVGTFGGVKIYGNTISGPVYRAHKKSTVVVQKLVNGAWVTQTDPGSGSVTFTIYAGSTVGGGSVTIDPSTPATVKTKTLVPAVLQKEKTTERKYAPWRYIPSEKTTAKKTFLVQADGASAVQNFAFDGMDGWDD